MVAPDGALLLKYHHPADQALVTRLGKAAYKPELALGMEDCFWLWVTSMRARRSVMTKKASLYRFFILFIFSNLISVQVL